MSYTRTISILVGKTKDNQTLANHHDDKSIYYQGKQMEIENLKVIKTDGFEDTPKVRFAMVAKHKENQPP